MPIYFLKPAIGKNIEKYFTQYSFKKIELTHLILFAFAFCGCDTTSAFAGIGKKKICDVLLKYPDLQKDVSVFYSPDATKTNLIAAGRSCIEALYGSNPKNDIGLDNLRFLCFNKKTTSTACKLTDLPPTKECANEHSLRVYLQIQKWLCNSNKSPLEYGWELTINGLMPITIPKGVKPIPQVLLESVACGCKSGCKTKACSCRKVGLDCHAACKYCSGLNCENIKKNLIEDEDDEVNNYEFEDNQSETNSDITSQSDLSDNVSDTSSIFSNQFHDLEYNGDESDMFAFNYETSDTEDTTDDEPTMISKKRRIV